MQGYTKLILVKSLRVNGEEGYVSPGKKAQKCYECKVTAVPWPPITEELNVFLQQCILAFGGLLSSRYPAWGLSEMPRWCDTGLIIL